MNDAAEKVVLAARATLHGGAEVTLDMSYDIPSAQGSAHLAGRADFVGGRCLLAGDGESFVFDGADEYSLREGRWSLSRGAPGTRTMADPAWLLGLLAEEDALHEIHQQADGELRGELDRDLAAATVAAGLWPGWKLRVGVRLDGGKVVTMRLETIDADSGGVGTRQAFELRAAAAVKPIDIPPPESVVAAPDLSDGPGATGSL